MKASTRDASWYNSPDTSTPKKYHVKDANGFAACSGSRILLTEELECPVEDVSRLLRCKRPGCKQHWPKELK